MKNKKKDKTFSKRFVLFLVIKQKYLSKTIAKYLACAIFKV